MRPRVELQPFAEEDRDAFLTAMRASRELHAPWISPPVDVPGWDAWLARAAQPDVEALLAVRVDDSAVAGYLVLSQIFRGALESAYLGFGAAAPLAGQGYMAEALALTVAHAFTGLELHRVEANVQSGNTRSLALVARAGFRLEGFSPRYLKVAGEWRDHQRWALTVEDWRGRRW